MVDTLGYDFAAFSTERIEQIEQPRQVAARGDPLPTEDRRIESGFSAVQRRRPRWFLVLRLWSGDADLTGSNVRRSVHGDPSFQFIIILLSASPLIGAGVPLGYKKRRNHKRNRP